jgi:hypothetical protein
MKQRLLTYAILLLVATHTSCYTATESTPRIKVDQEAYQPTIEELVIDNNFAHMGCHTWVEGKAFFSIEDNLSPMLRPEGDAPISDNGLKDKTFFYMPPYKYDSQNLDRWSDIF